MVNVSANLHEKLSNTSNYYDLIIIQPVNISIFSFDRLMERLMVFLVQFFWSALLLCVKPAEWPHNKATIMFIFLCFFSFIGSPLAVTSATAPLPGVHITNIHINPIYDNIYISRYMNTSLIFLYTHSHHTCQQSHFQHFTNYIKI